MVQNLPALSIEEDFLYPESDGKPVADNTIQFRLIMTIQGGLDALFQDREDVFVAGDLLWYPRQVSAVKPEENLPFSQAPDVMVVFGRPKEDRGSYKQWQEENIAPQVTFEILSPSNTKGEMDDKFRFYQSYGVEEYYLYNPKKNRLQGWIRRGAVLEEIAQMEQWKSPYLGVSFSTVSGDLQLFTPNGEAFGSYVDIVGERDRQKHRANTAESALELEREQNQELQARLQALEAQLKQLQDGSES